MCSCNSVQSRLLSGFDSVYIHILYILKLFLGLFGSGLTVLGTVLDWFFSF